MAIDTKEKALIRQENDIDVAQEKHGALDIKTIVQAQSKPDEVEPDQVYEEADLRRLIPWGFQINEMIVRAYEGDLGA